MVRFTEERTRFITSWIKGGAGSCRCTCYLRSGGSWVLTLYKRQAGPEGRDLAIKKSAFESMRSAKVAAEQWLEAACG